MVQADILAEGSRIRKAEPGICDRAVSEIDATGCYVTPGLVDHHTHIYPMASIGISGEAVCFGSGVTTAVDAGSTGCGTYDRYRPWIRASKLAVCPYIHVSTGGLSSLPEAMEEVDPHHMDAEGIRELFRRYGNELAGLKIRISRNIVGDLGMDPLKRAVEIAELTGVPDGPYYGPAGTDRRSSFCPPAWGYRYPYVSEHRTNDPGSRRRLGCRKGGAGKGDPV